MDLQRRFASVAIALVFCSESYVFLVQKLYLLSASKFIAGINQKTYILTLRTQNKYIYIYIYFFFFLQAPYWLPSLSNFSSIFSCTALSVFSFLHFATLTKPHKFSKICALQKNVINKTQTLFSLYMHYLPSENLFFFSLFVSRSIL